MKDMVTNGTGNSRYLKTSLASGTTWESALAMLREGTFPIDLNGLNNGGITQLGSAYSKANVLPDDVCALLGLDSTTAEPKDAFNVVGNPAELWVWKKFNYTPASYHDGEIDINEIILLKTGTGATEEIYYSDSISVDEHGTVILINPSTLYLSYNNYSNASVLKGKYIRRAVLSQVAFIPTTATFSREVSGGNYSVRASTLTYIDGVAAVVSNVEYVSSPNSSTYPEHGQSGDYWYTRLGQIGGGMTKIETGSYVGTGTYGSSNPNSLTFGFRPFLVIVTRDDMPGSMMIIAVNSLTTQYKRYGAVSNFGGEALGNDINFYASFSNNTLSWYHNNSSTGTENQGNFSDYTYNFAAIG